MRIAQQNRTTSAKGSSSITTAPHPGIPSPLSLFCPETSDAWQVVEKPEHGNGLTVP